VHNYRAVLASTLLYAALVSCDGSRTDIPDTHPVQLPAPVAELRRVTTGDPRIEGWFAGAPDARVALELVQTPNGLQFAAASSGAVTDVFIELDAALMASGTGVEWAAELDVHWVSLALRGDDGTLHLGLAARTRQTVDGWSGPDQLAAASADRYSLPEHCTLLTLGPGGEPPLTARSATAIDTKNIAPQPTVVAVEGEYSVRWPAQLRGDYNQDGLVSINDLTPLAVLLGSRRFGDLWALDAQARVDGNGDGLISVSDLTPLGAAFGQQLTGFTVEHSLGTVDGPGAWDVLLSGLPLAPTDSLGETVKPLGPARQMRFSTPVVAGYAYYRITLELSGGATSAPGAAALAPDVTAPVWPAGAQLAQLQPLEEQQFTFAVDAADDRSGVEYALALASGPSTGRRLLLELNAASSPEPLVPPYEVRRFVVDGNTGTLRLTADGQYWLQLTATDAAGNRAASDWVALTHFLDLPGTGVFIENEWDIWVNRRGDVRVTPPAYGNWDPAGTVELLVQVQPLGTYPGGDADIDAGDFTAALIIPYYGGEVLLEGLLQPGEWAALGFAVYGNGDQGFKWFGAAYPSGWLTPFAAGTEVGSVAPLTLPQSGTVATVAALTTNATEQDTCWCRFQGSSFAQTPLGFDLEFDYISEFVPVPETDVILLRQRVGAFPHELTWFSATRGRLGSATIPEFTRDGFAFEEVVRWAPEDPETAIGALNLMRPNAQDEPSFELWEAHRDGSYGVREYLPFDELTASSSIYGTFRAGANLVFEYVREAGGPPGADARRYAVRTANSWFTFPKDELPTALNAAAWDELTVADVLFGVADTFIYITGYKGQHPTWTHYHGVYKGDVRQGFASFIKVWETDDAGTIDPGQPAVKGQGFSVTALNGYGNYLLPWDPGAVILRLENDGTGRSQLARIAAQGYVRWSYPDFTYDDFNLRSKTFEQLVSGVGTGGPIGTFAKARLSADGEWISSGDGGTWGVATLSVP
jgi:hypothetical protein